MANSLEPPQGGGATSALVASTRAADGRDGPGRGLSSLLWTFPADGQGEEDGQPRRVRRAAGTRRPGQLVRGRRLLMRLSSGGRRQSRSVTWLPRCRCWPCRFAEKEEEEQRKAEFARQVEELRQASSARARELQRSKRKRKRRKKKLPRTSSRPFCGRACRRQRQWHARFAGFAGDVTFRAVFPSVVAWPEMLGIVAGMDLKDSPWHVQGLFFFLALCSLWLQTGPDARHLGRYGPEGHVRSWLVSLNGPLCLAVTCSIWFWPEEYSYSIFWEMLSRYVVFSASWFDSGYMLRPVYGSLRCFFPYSAQCLVLSGRRFHCRLLLDKVFVVSVVQVVLLPGCGPDVQKTVAIPIGAVHGHGVHARSCPDSADNRGASKVVDFPFVPQSQLS